MRSKWWPWVAFSHASPGSSNSIHRRPTPNCGRRYFEKIDVLSAPNYTPSEEDVLLCRSRTIGIVKTVLEIDKNEFNIYDVGGQRNERRKWIHCFDEVTAVIFVAALSEYDQVAPSAYAEGWGGYHTHSQLAMLGGATLVVITMVRGMG